MGHVNIKDRTTADAAACPFLACAEPAGVEPGGAEPATGGPEAGAQPRELLRTVLDKGRALMRVYFHSRKVRAAANALAQALAESREASSWPGDRLPVGEEMSVQVEKLTHRLKLETEAHYRLEALFRSVNLGRSAAAV
ncbi:hypothetical protein [Arthrobacter sp. ZGTC412]|uniref:hypothetical protein n=1 Tax=Arthrobacter sp. ZGTC412 TaxID=2058900 RepID=UPI002157DEC6|nr:hypothetical protein [Arthrobacter sp. ZGTC412]